jgi:hypothetical protein
MLNKGLSIYNCPKTSKIVTAHFVRSYPLKYKTDLMPDKNSRRMISPLRLYSGPACPISVKIRMLVFVEFQHYLLVSGTAKKL